MNVVFALVVTTLRGMRRDRSALIFLLILPVALMVMMGNIYAAEDADLPAVAVLADESDLTSAAVVDSLRSAGSVELEVVEDRTALDDAVRRRRVDAGVVVGTDGAVQLVGAPDVQLPGGIRFIVSGAVTRVDRAAALAATSPELTMAAVLDALPAPGTMPVDDGHEARTEAAIGVLVLVTFMNLLAYASLVPTHRSIGVLDRLGVVPTRRGTVIVGYAASFVTVATVQLTLALLAGRFLVGIGWGPVAQVAIVAAGLAVAAAGLATLAATLLPSPESGSTLGGPVGFALGMLGGCLWPLSFVGGLLEQIGGWVPHQWAVASLTDIASGDATLTSLTPAVVALVGFGMVGAALGGRRLASSW